MTKSPCSGCDHEHLSKFAAPCSCCELPAEYYEQLSNEHPMAPTKEWSHHGSGRVTKSRGGAL